MDAARHVRTWLAWVVLAALGPGVAPALGDEEWITIEGAEGPGRGKQVVLISGDEEYRSEEALPQLAWILARHHGFRCTVLFAIDPKDGTINPTVRDNIPGLAALDSADLMVIATRFRDLPDEQMARIDRYLAAGKPVIGLRTATHAFDVKPGKTFSRYGWRSTEPGWEGGFGRRVLGETWISHHGQHGKQSTRGVLAPGLDDGPLARGLKPGSIWGPTDVYGVRLPQPETCRPIVLGQVLAGMKPSDEPVAGKVNDPLMPLAWTNTYPAEGGKTPRVFTTTMGASQDFQSEGLRRLVVNACYWTLAMEDQLAPERKVDLVEPYTPHPFGFGTFIKGVKPPDLVAGP